MADPSASEDPREPPLVALEGPLPSAIADLASIEQDVEYVIAACEMLLPMVENEDPLPPPTAVLVRALWESAVVAYGRCFATGRALALPKGQRRRADEYVDGRLDESARSAHADTLEMRNQHIAHRVIAAEQMKVLVILNPEGTPRGVQGVMAFGIRFAAANRERAEGLLSLARELRVLIAADREALQDQLIARSSRRIDEMYEWAQRSVSEEGELRIQGVDDAIE